MPNIFDTANISEIYLTNVAGYRLKITTDVFLPWNASNVSLTDLKVTYCQFKTNYLADNSGLKKFIDNGLITYTVDIGSSEIPCSSDPVYTAAEIDTKIEDAVLGFALKADVTVVTKGLGNRALSGLGTIHGYALTGDGTERVGVTENTDASENGIWIPLSGDWERAPDFDGNPNGEVKGGSTFYVSENDSTYAGYRFYVTGENIALEIGVDDINFGYIKFKKYKRIGFTSPTLNGSNLIFTIADVYDTGTDAFIFNGRILPTSNYGLSGTGNRTLTLNSTFTDAYGGAPSSTDEIDFWAVN